MKRYESQRIYLRLIEAADMDEKFMSWFEDESLMKFYTNSKRKITKSGLLKNIAEGKKNNNNFTYGIFHKEADECIGTVKIGYINHIHKISDLATLVGNKNYHGKGLASEAIRLGNHIAFEQYGIRKLFSGVYESNIASIKAYIRADWIIEGRLKGHYLVDGKMEDRILIGCFNPAYFTPEEIEHAKYKD